MANFLYPKAGLHAPAGVKEAIKQFHRLPIVERRQVPLLYFLLGDGTPPYKMDPLDAAYQNTPVRQMKCGNCLHMYQHNKSRTYICDQISTPIQPDGWCRLWSP